MQKVWLIIVVLLALLSTCSAAREDDLVVKKMPYAIDEVGTNEEAEELEPVEVRLFNERHLSFTVPESVIQALDTWFGVKVPRVQKLHNTIPPPPPPDAPVLSGGILHQPIDADRLKEQGSRLKRGEELPVAETIPGEWLVTVRKDFSSDFVSVLEDLGEHLHARFGLRQWRDAAANLRQARQQHEERQRRRREAGQAEEAPFKVELYSRGDGAMAIQFGRRMILSVKLPADVLHRENEFVESLRQKEWTEIIEPNMVVRKTAIATQTLGDSNTYNWGIDRVDQRDLPLNNQYRYPQGASTVKIYVLDTGVQINHTEFANGNRAQWGTNTIDFINEDCDGHGTHVAGIAAGVNVGIAKQAQVYAVKVLDCSGQGSTQSLVQGILYAISNCGSSNCVISLSLGSKGVSTAIDDAIQQAYNSGIVTVAAAGNSNADACLYSPASSQYVITVGATTDTDTRSSFSNYGTCVDIFAPGSSIRSSYKDITTNYYMTISGTSQATPHVSGAAALYVGVTNTGATPSEVAGALYASSTFNKVKNTGPGSPNRLLYSLVDLGDSAITPEQVCQPASACISTNGTLNALASTNVPQERYVVTRDVTSFGYFQGWLKASGDFDLALQYYNGTPSGWVTVASSSGNSGDERIQYSVGASGAGWYRWRIFANVAGNYTFIYQFPASYQAGQQVNSASTSASFLMPFYKTLLSLF